MPKNKNYCKITLSRRDSSKEIASNSREGKEIWKIRILNVINNIEEILKNNKKIKLSENELKKFNNIISKLEVTYKN